MRKEIQGPQGSDRAKRDPPARKKEGCNDARQDDAKELVAEVGQLGEEFVHCTLSALRKHPRFSCARIERRRGPRQQQCPPSRPDSSVTTSQAVPTRGRRAVK